MLTNFLITQMIITMYILTRMAYSSLKVNVLIKCLVTLTLSQKKGFNFFQKFMKSSGAIDRLEELGIEEGDTVRVGDYLEFDYYRA